MSMRCLLINPYYPLSENPSPPLGLAYLAAALEKAGVEVEILDFVVFPYIAADFRSKLEQFAPDIVAATAVTMTFDRAIRIIQEARRWSPACLTVMGGPHVTFCAQETLAAFPELDLVALGEGEETLVEIAAEAGKGRNWQRIPGLVFRQGGSMVSTGKRPHPIDVNTLELPARHLLALGRYRTLGMPISMTTSRGCPYACIFCVGRKMVGAKVRYRDPIKVVDEMEILAGYGFCQINVADDLFTANAQHCLAVCDEILKRDLKVKWTSFARVDTVSLKVLQRMKAAGCQAVSFGIESGNAEILKTIRKGITLSQVIEAVNLCNQAGLLPHGSFILGLPGETPETLKETLAFGEKLKKLGVSYGFHLLAPFPGTRVRKDCAELGITILSNDWSDYHANRAIVETPAVTRQMLNDIVIGWENDFNQYLGLVAERMAAGEASEAEAWPLVNLERTVAIYDLMMENALEKRGSWTTRSRSEHPGDLLNDLADHLAMPAAGLEKRVSALFHALENGFLKYSVTADRIRWQWVDRIDDRKDCIICDR
jgi:anaerobic magnesium-protoporphyrin IX monomethyl ester cyclase